MIRNAEVQELVPALLAAIADPNTKAKPALDTLLTTEFVNAVDAASLALIVPVVHRGLRDRSGDVKKKAARIVGNMCVLINEPKVSIRNLELRWLVRIGAKKHIYCSLPCTLPMNNEYVFSLQVDVDLHVDIVYMGCDNTAAWRSLPGSSSFGLGGESWGIACAGHGALCAAVDAGAAERAGGPSAGGARDGREGARLAAQGHGRAALPRPHALAARHS